MKESGDFAFGTILESDTVSGLEGGSSAITWAMLPPMKKEVDSNYGDGERRRSSGGKQKTTYL